MRKILLASKKNKGMTLVELLVALAIFSMGIAGVTLLFSKAWKTNSYVLEEGRTTAAVSKTLSDMIKNIRKTRQADDGSYAIKSVGDFDLVLYLDTDKDGKTERVHYFLDNGQNLRKGVTKFDINTHTYSSADQTVTTVAQFITNTPSQPIFTYYNKLYPIDLNGNPLANPQPADVRLIGIHLWINIKPKTAPDNIKTESFVELRNLNENN